MGSEYLLLIFVVIGGGALYPEIDQSGPTANGMSSKQHQSISFHFCLTFLSDRELLDCPNCTIPTNCQGEVKFHLRSVKVSRIESSWERISRLYTSWRHLGADNGSDSFFVLFLEPETLQNWLRTSRFPKFLREKRIWWFRCKEERGPNLESWCSKSHRRPLNHLLPTKWVRMRSY